MSKQTVVWKGNDWGECWLKYSEDFLDEEKFECIVQRGTTDSLLSETENGDPGRVK